MSSESELRDLRRELDALRDEVGVHADIHAVRTLQFKYGYYMDKCLFGAIVDLFAEDAVLYFMNGVFRGKRGARRLYGGASGLDGPVRGMLFEHIIAQDIVDVAPDRRTAKGRFRCFLQGGVHQSKQDAPPRIPAQFLEAGIYENEYVKEDGVWKIKSDHVFNTYFVPYTVGWKSVQPRPPPGITDSNPPDRPPSVPFEMYPQPFLPPFHYANPVTGALVTWTDSQ
jgi:hypothetical protein